MATTETMTVHKALAELKILDKRIMNAMSDAVLIATKKNNQEKIRGKNVTDFNTDAVSSYDHITGLIKRRNAIKNAVNVSNATTTVRIGDDEYTVVEAIDKKNHAMEYYTELRDLMAQQFNARSNEVDKHNDSLQQKAEQFVTGLGGEVKKGSDEYTTTISTYIKSNTMELIDPLNLERKIKDLDEEINAFMPEVDAALSSSNAVTTITISY